MARTAWLSALVLLPLLAACAGDLEHPERFSAPSTGTGCDLDVLEDVLRPKCGIPGCHSASSPSAGLDLVSDGQADRLVGVESPMINECNGRVRLDPADVEGSLLVQKLHPSPPCGTQMPPVGGALSDEEVQCVTEWAEELAAAGGGGGDGGAAGADGGAPVADGGL